MKDCELNVDSTDEESTSGLETKVQPASEMEWDEAAFDPDLYLVMRSIAQTPAREVLQRHLEGN